MLARHIQIWTSGPTKPGLKNPYCGAPDGLFDSLELKSLWSKSFSRKDYKKKMVSKSAWIFPATIQPCNLKRVTEGRTRAWVQWEDLKWETVLERMSFGLHVCIKYAWTGQTGYTTVRSRCLQSLKREFLLLILQVSLTFDPWPILSTYQHECNA